MVETYIAYFLMLGIGCGPNEWSPIKKSHVKQVCGDSEYRDHILLEFTSYAAEKRTTLNGLEKTEVGSATKSSSSRHRLL